MKSTLQIGNSAEVIITVTQDMCPAFDGVVVHQVYSTWSMAHHMELAARKVLAPHLEDHEEGIGSHLSIDHHAPTPLGETVRVGKGKQIQRILPKTKLKALIERARA